MNQQTTRLHIGTQLITLRGENDSDEHDELRITAPNTVGKIEHIDTDIADDPLYHVIFPNGAWIILDTSEITDPQLYTVSVATISSGLRGNSCHVIHHTRTRRYPEGAH